MADRANITKPSNATTKPTQLYNPTHPLYRPQQTRRRRKSSCCYHFCCTISLILVILLLIFSGAIAVAYLIVHPKPPSFTLNSIKFTSFNISSKSHLNTKLNLTITTSNPNKVVTFTYDTVKISTLVTSNDIEVAAGTLHGFMHGKMDVKDLSVLIGGDKEISSEVVKFVKDGLKKGLGLTVKLETKVKVSMFGFLKSPKFGVWVVCDGVRVKKGGKNGVKNVSDGHIKCKVNVRFKILGTSF